jgi:dihydrofolate reductase
MPFSIIVGAHATNWAIGSAGKIPWKCRADMKFFKETTSNVNDSTKMNAVIMGRKTFESLLAPLPNRLNVVLTKGTNSSLLIPPLIKNNDSIVFSNNSKNSIVFSNNFDKIIDELELNPNIETIFVIGGETIYKQALLHPKCKKIYLNMVQVECDLSGADAFFPDIDLTKYGLVETTIIDPTVTSYVYKKMFNEGHDKSK